MKAISVAQADALLSSWGSASVADGIASLRSPPVAINLPIDCGRKSALARYLTYEALSGEKVIVYVFDEEVFEHEENTHLVHTWRKGLGEVRDLASSPCHVFEGSETLDLCAILALAMFFVWSAAVFAQSSDLMLLISHDEYLALTSPDEARLREIIDDLRDYEEERGRPD